MDYVTKCEMFVCILAGNPNGSSVDFQWTDGGTRCGYLILRSDNHLSVVFGSQNNLYRDLLGRNVSWVMVCF